MEKILQSTIVKQGLIIAYYFSNRWYRKCLFSDSHTQNPNHSGMVGSPEADPDETETVAKSDTKYTHEQTAQDLHDKKHTIEKELKLNSIPDNPVLPDHWKTSKPS